MYCVLTVVLNYRKSCGASLKVSVKFKIFCWRAMHGILSLKLTLANRHIGTSSHCTLFLIESKDVFHMTLKCRVFGDRLGWRA